MPSSMLSIWEWFTIPLVSVLTVGAFVASYLAFLFTLKWACSKFKGFVMEKMREAGFYAGIEAQERHEYNCQACMDVMRKLKIEVNTERGQAFVKGWKESSE